MRTPARSAEPKPAQPCRHLTRICPVEPAIGYCRDCVASSQAWLELWVCLSCGWVACSNDSPSHHAEAHYAETDHPIAAPLHGPPGTRWCFIDQRYV